MDPEGSEKDMINITTGDVLHAYGGFGQNEDYTVRLVCRMEDAVDGDMLRKAVKSAEKRFPYLLLRMHRDDEKIFYEENREPVAVINRKDRVRLGAAETGYHMWAVCYFEDNIYLEFYHGLCDGTGMYMVLSTILYYYVNQKYGETKEDGVRKVGEEIDPAEYRDPVDMLPEIDIRGIERPERKPAFSLIHDGGFTPCNTKIYEITIPERDFVKFSAENDASPGVMVSVLMARSIDRLFSERDKAVLSAYVVNARPMLGGMKSHHNCVTTVSLDYSERIRQMDFDRQCTVYRGKTFLQSDEDVVKNNFTYVSSMYKGVMKSTPALEDKLKTFGNMILGGSTFFTFIVSYVGKWKHEAIGRHIREFWTHVPSANDFLIEIAAVNGSIFLTVHQNFKEDALVKAFEREMAERGIECHVKEGVNDVAELKLPEKVSR